MKAKKLLSVISLVLAFLIAFNSTAVAMDSAADYLNEVVLSNSEKTEEFNYPEAVPPDVDEKTVSNSSELRLPDVQSSISTEELEYGKPVEHGCPQLLIPMKLYLSINTIQWVKL